MRSARLQPLATSLRTACVATRWPGRTDARRCFSSTRTPAAIYGFIGLGQMGYRMAKNLREKLPKDDVLLVNDINHRACDAFVKELSGYAVRASPSAREIAEQASTIITALPEPQHVKAVYKDMLEPATLKQVSADSDRLFIDTSTIDPTTSSEVARMAVSTKQGRFVDAPMSGGTVGAAAGTLTFMIGSPDDLVPRATSVLSYMGRRVLHLGGPTSGLKGKLANNYLLALNNIATCEAMSMGVAWGLDPKALANMINTSTGKCWPSEVNNPVPGVIETSPSSRDYDGGFGVALMNKDLKLALKAAEEFSVNVRLGPLAQQVYDEVQSKPKLRTKDFSVVYRYLEGKE